MHDFGLRPDDAWGLTLYEFIELLNRFNEKQRRHDYRMAVICTMLAKLGGSKKVKPEDFMPKPKQTVKDMVQKAETLTAFYGDGE